MIYFVANIGYFCDLVKFVFCNKFSIYLLQNDQSVILYNIASRHLLSVIMIGSAYANNVG